MTAQNDNQEQKIKELQKQEAEGLAKILSKKYGVSYIDLSLMSIDTDALSLIPEQKARLAKVAAFNLSDKRVHLIVLSPQNPAVEEVLSDLKNKGYEATVYMGSMTSLERAWERYKEVNFTVETKSGIIDIAISELENYREKIKTVASVKELIEDVSHKESGRGISLLLEIVLSGAIKTGASDIHMEPQEEAVRLRYRLDGVLHDIAFIPYQFYKLIVSRIKLISTLKLNIKQSAQDGRFSINIDEKQIEVRTSILPGAYGETIVLRILDPDSVAIDLEQMGIEPYLFKIFKDEISKPNGMLLITGPTGSGKTTTLYAFLRRINKPETKIITIEDPVEYKLEGISQTQVNKEKGYTFIAGLRSALRQDPDVIMIGEIRDEETAKTAVNAALTGHLVFSTLHTNNAAGSIPRLIDLGVNAKILSSAINITAAQRLVRRLCEACRKEEEITGQDKITIDKIISAIQKKRKEINITNREKMWSAVGCEKCNGLGYKGRVGVFEAIVVNQDIGKTLNDNSNESDVWLAAETQGILRMHEDGVLKVLDGTTSLDEVRRVVAIDEMPASSEESQKLEL